MNFKILDAFGREVNCELLYTFKNPKTGISYIIYTDGELNEDGKIEVLASRYVEESGNFILKDILDDAEWDLIDEFLASKNDEQ